MRDLSDSAHGGPRDWVSQYGISAFVCTVISSSRGVSALYGHSPLLVSVG